MEKCILYLDNGDNYIGDEFTYAEAKIYLGSEGYNRAYTGRKHGPDGMKVLVGIDEHNKVDIKERRANGLYRAKRIRIKTFTAAVHITRNDHPEFIGKVTASSIPHLKLKARQKAVTSNKHLYGRIHIQIVDSERNYWINP